MIVHQIASHVRNKMMILYCWCVIIPLKQYYYVGGTRMKDDNCSILIDDDCLEKVTGGTVSGKYIQYTVQRGDNLTKIASRYCTSIPAIMALNPIIIDRNFIKPGWTLKVPDNR